MAGGIKSKGGKDRLTVTTIRTFLARHGRGELARNAKLSDGQGLYLFVTPAGTPVWRVKYRHGGKEGTYSIGPYGDREPGITPTAARIERDKVKAYLRDGKNPLQMRTLERAATQSSGENTFKAIAEKWLEKQQPGWSATHYSKSKRAIERDVFPLLGPLPVADIRPAMVTRIVESISMRGAVDTAAKVRQHIGGIFRLAQARGLCDYKENPADPAREVLPKKSQRKRRPAFLTWKELGGVLRAANRASLSPVVRLAHRLCAFSGVRISNVVTAEWREFDLETSPATWTIPRRKMKAKDRDHDHQVILGPTIEDELREWRNLVGSKGFVFPSPAGGKHITRESIEKAYRVTLKLEDRHTPHGWRSALSTLAREEGGFEKDVVELALDHVHDTEIVRAYDRGPRMPQRIKLMMWWDASLSRAERGADVITIAA